MRRKIYLEKREYSFPHTCPSQGKRKKYLDQSAEGLETRHQLGIVDVRNKIIWKH